MLNMNRQQYISKHSSEKINIPSPSNTNADEVRTMIVDTLKLLSKNVDGINQSIKAIEEKLEYLDIRQRSVEDQVSRYKTKANVTDSDLSSIRSELDGIRREKRVHPAAIDQELNSTPMMPGTGFASITPEYLKSLQNR